MMPDTRTTPPMSAEPMPGDVWQKGNRLRYVETVRSVPVGPRNDRDYIGFQTATDRRRKQITFERPDVFARWAAGATLIKREDRSNA